MTNFEVPKYHQHLPREFTLPARGCTECPFYSPKIVWCRRWLRKASGSCPDVKVTARYEPPRHDDIHPINRSRHSGAQ